MKTANINAEQIFAAAIELGKADTRREFIERSCGSDSALLEEVKSLLAAHEKAGGFMDTPARPVVEQPGFLTPGRRRLGDYELLEEIARGGMGVVYKARQVSLQRTVAIKMILAGQLASEDEVRRFRSEAAAAASLNHPHIVGIYDVGESGGHHFYSMPFVEGANLAQLVESGSWRPGDGTEGARLVAKLARALEHAHKAGIVHRDLKPGNILVRPDGEPCIADFGLAKRLTGEASLTLTGQLWGTPSFMAPEQASGKGRTVGPRADIYSLGAVLYYLLTGRPPFVADSALDALLLVIESEAVLPRNINKRIPTDLQRICLRCLEKSPEYRYAGAGELAEDLERYLKGEPLASAGKSIPHRMQARLLRQPALFCRLIGVAICSIVSITGYHFSHHLSQTNHLLILAVLLWWALISVLCQVWIERGQRPNAARLVWAGADLTSLTAALALAGGLSGPLVILYPTLVAGSGLWQRVQLVGATTVMALAGYGVLMLTSRGAAQHPVPDHWHVIAVVGIVVTGISVAYLVNRVSALTRFYERRA